MKSSGTPAALRQTLRSRRLDDARLLTGAELATAEHADQIERLVMQNRKIEEAIDRLQACRHP